MVKFWRNIRRKLIEQGSLKRYLFYAVGEILLVMIGILLALQVNNWNENRKNITLLKSYTNSLIQDLKQDAIVLNSIIDFADQDNIVLKHLTDRLSSPYSNFDTLRKITRYELPIDYKVYRPPNNKTLLAMQSNGIVEYFDKETYNYLVELQGSQNIVESQTKLQISSHQKQAEYLTSKYTLNGYNVIKGPLLEQSWRNVDADDLFRRVESFMATKKFMNTYGNINRRELLKLTEKTLSRLLEIQTKND